MESQPLQSLRKIGGREPAEIKSEFTRPRIAASELRLAEELVGKWQTGKFDFSAYKDRYRQKVKEAIAAKKKVLEIAPPEEEEHPGVINLMDALKKSVAKVDKTSRARRSSGAARHKTTRRKRA
jgi:non-homologous end joining protein Ku